jgi:putative FmdB family regulatory protein
MPTYHYECEICGNEFDYMQPILSSKLELCANCGEKSLFRHIGNGCAIVMDTKFRDEKGTKIWYPNNNDNPYYDKALNRVFKNKKDKKQYMKENKVVMDGSMDHPQWYRRPEAGDTMGHKKPIYSRPIKEKKDGKTDSRLHKNSRSKGCSS